MSFRSAGHCRRGMILLAVLLVVAIAALVGAAGMYAADAELSGAGVSLRQAEARALAWSGVQAAMAELAGQRGAILEGGTPRVTGEWELFSDPTGVRGIVRLLPFDDGTFLESEAGKLDLNSATPEMLEGVPGLNAEVAGAIIAAREKHPFSSVESLGQVPGITAELLWGGDHGTGGDSGLTRYLSVFASEPNVQFGVGERASEHRGLRRVAMATISSARLAEALAVRFGTELGARVNELFRADEPPRHPSNLVAALRMKGVEPGEWPGVLDLLSASPDPYLVGRVDLNIASAATLACIPGIGSAESEQIVQERGRLGSAVLASPAWLVLQGILSPEQFECAADHLTTRSFQWRVRVEAGLTAGGDTDHEPTREARLAWRVVLDAVIDIASEQPRVAYLRDITLMNIAKGMYAEAAIDEQPGVAAAPAPAAPSSPAQEAPRPPIEANDGPTPAPPPATVRAEDRRIGRWRAGQTGGEPR